MEPEVVYPSRWRLVLSPTGAAILPALCVLGWVNIGRDEIGHSRSGASYVALALVFLLLVVATIGGFVWLALTLGESAQALRRPVPLLRLDVDGLECGLGR